MNSFSSNEPKPNLRQLRDHSNLATEEGELAHALIQFVATKFGGDPTPEQVVDASKRFKVASRSGSRAAASRAASTTRAARFFRRFSRPGWVLLGVELSVGDVRFDLVWKKDGVVEADEVKSGRIGAWTQEETVRLQLFEQFLAGRHRWGSDFRGVRLVPLLQPEKSYLYKGEDTP